MKQSETDILIEKFFNGETTDEEERLLHEASLIPHLYPQSPVPEGLEHRLSRQIDQWSSIEKRSEKRARMTVIRWVTGIAAGVVLIVGIAIPALREPDAEKYAEEQETYNDPEKAQIEAEKALAKFSDCINKGFDIIDKTTNKNIEQ
ncbi:MAG: hypothetical protein SOZ80_06450 [Prevotella sp.]|uniref:hypothetical protein n=1 Tax=Prevotella sp. TaxID=59823 RepID=UPI002A27311A|nr:hypothetical protein [Prevotella sp.]MDD7318593.1 hypothetical protein [Prevotellaceae bacterium]MDY4020394.1 hypothetical protein [Prevotella sp.]